MSWKARSCSGFGGGSGATVFRTVAAATGRGGALLCVEVAEPAGTADAAGDPDVAGFAEAAGAEADAAGAAEAAAFALAAGCDLAAGAASRKRPTSAAPVSIIERVGDVTDPP